MSKSNRQLLNDLVLISRSIKIALSASLYIMLFGASPTQAFDRRWDQGHESPIPDDGNDGDPGNPGPNKCASPFEVQNGNFFYSEIDIFIPAVGPDLRFARTYNSQDRRSGPFGVGWSSSYDEYLKSTNDGRTSYAIQHLPGGKRARYAAVDGGAFAAPKGVFGTLSSTSSGMMVRGKDGTDELFDLNGQLSKRIDRNGNSISFSYDSDGFLTKVEHSNGYFLMFERNSEGRVSVLKDHSGREVRYEYDIRGDLRSIKDLRGITTFIEYDDSHRLLKVTDGRGNIMQRITYDGKGRVNRYIEKGREYSVTYSETGVVTKRDPRGYLFTVKCASTGAVTERVLPNGVKSQTFYDDALNIIGFTDKLGNKITRTFDSKGNVLSAVNSLGEVTRFTYESSFNQVSSVIDPLGNTIVYEYDSRGNMTKSVDALGNKSSFTYDERGLMLTATDAEGFVTKFAYDDKGNMTSVIDPRGNMVSYTYDAVGNVIKRTDPLGRDSTLNYDAGGLVRSISAPLNVMTRFSYDQSNNVTGLTDTLGRTTNFTLNAGRQVTDVENPFRKLFHMEYDVVGGKLKNISDPDFRTQSFAYNNLDLLDTAVTPDAVRKYKYDSAGNLISVVSSTDNISLVYDSLDRLSQSSSANGSIGLNYSAAGKISLITDSFGGKVSYLPQNGIGQALGISISSAKNGLSDQIYGNAKIEYSPRGQLKQIALKAAQSSNSYDILSHFSFDEAKNLTRHTEQNSTSESLVDISYTRDELNRIIKKDEKIKGGLGRLLEYSYDEMGRLTRVIEGGVERASYSYDLHGNRLSATYNGNRIQSIFDREDRQISNGSAIFTYNDSGQLKQKSEGEAVTVYNYDVESNLRKVTLPDGTVIEYQIDNLGRRIGKSVNGSQQYRFLYQDMHRPLVEIAADGSERARYIYLSHVSVPDFMVRDSKLYRVITDELGSPRLTVEVDSGAVVQRIDYDEFGVVLSDSNPGFIPFGFAGGLYDQDTKLVRFGLRDYDPSVGRWTTMDPIGFSGGSTNLYLYSRGDPINGADPSGQNPVLIFCAINPEACAAALIVGAEAAAEAWDALNDLWDNYQDMKDVNTIGADKYFHCVAHCEATREGPVGWGVSETVGYGREVYDFFAPKYNRRERQWHWGDSLEACMDDLDANSDGRNGDSGQSCREVCDGHRPNGLPNRF